MTATMLNRTPDLDFLYYSNDLIAAGGLLHLMAEGIAVPSDMGLAGFNKVELIEGLPQRPATMDSCRFEIGQKAAEIILARAMGQDVDTRIELQPTIAYGDTLRRKLV